MQGTSSSVILKSSSPSVVKYKMFFCVETLWRVGKDRRGSLYFQKQIIKIQVAKSRHRKGQMTVF